MPPKKGKEKDESLWADRVQKQVVKTGLKLCGPFSELQRFAQSKGWIVQANQMTKGEFGFRYSITVKSNDKLKPMLAQDCPAYDTVESLDDIRPNNRFSRTYDCRSRGYPSADFAKEMQSLYALVNLGYNQWDTLEPRWYERAMEIKRKGNEKQFPQKKPAEGAPQEEEVDKRLLNSALAAACVKHGTRTNESAWDAEGNEIVRAVFRLGDKELFCINDEKLAPVGMMTVPRETRSSLPPPPPNQRVKGFVSTWREDGGFGFATVAGHTDVFIHASALPQPAYTAPKKKAPSNKEVKKAPPPRPSLAPGQVVEFAVVWDGGRARATNVKVL